MPVPRAPAPTLPVPRPPADQAYYAAPQPYGGYPPPQMSGAYGLPAVPPLPSPALPTAPWDPALLTALHATPTPNNYTGGGDWYMDTGATAHMFAHPGNLASFTLSPPTAASLSATNLVSVRCLTRENPVTVEYDELGFCVKDARTRMVPPAVPPATGDAGSSTSLPGRLRTSLGPPLALRRAPPPAAPPTAAGLAPAPPGARGLLGAPCSPRRPVGAPGLLGAPGPRASGTCGRHGHPRLYGRFSPELATPRMTTSMRRPPLSRRHCHPPSEPLFVTRSGWLRCKRSLTPCCATGRGSLFPIPGTPT
nr:protein transport protein SEC31-like [Aegilops tauschii subsp. strangulata]